MERFCIPPEANASFVAAMEDVLGTYERPHDERRPLVCLDEASKQLIGEERKEIPAKPGQPARVDYEYTRLGTVNLFMLNAPHLGWRGVRVTDRRTGGDFAHVIQALVDDIFPEADKIVLVLDNLNTHKVASLYEAFEPAVAKRLADKLEIHYTPVHGSWLNMAEIELSVLTRQCLDRRIDNKAEVEREVQAWEDERNDKGVGINWQFTTEDARVKLRRLYPSPQNG